MYRTLIIALLALTVLSKIGSQKAAVLDIKTLELPMNATKNFLLKNLDQAKALMINVQQTAEPSNFTEFQISITAEGSKEVQCHFKYANNLCVLEKAAKETSIKMTCLSDQCKVNLVFSQRVLVRTGTQPIYKKRLNNPGQIYQLDKRRVNTILQVYAEREQHQILSHEIVVFCNIHAFPLHQIEELDMNSAIFGLKPIKQDEDQYIFIENKSKKNEQLKFTLKTHKGVLRDGISIVDFIENYGKHSHNNYTYMGEFHKNIQVNVRVFSPRDPKDIPLTLIVQGKNAQNEEEKEIRSLKFNPIDFEEQRVYDFTFAITKAAHSSFKIVSFQLLLHEVEDKSVFFEIGVRDVDTFEISIFDHIFFGSKAKEQLHFAVESQVKLMLSDGNKDIQILTNANEKYFANIQSCSLHNGCLIDIKADNECSSCSFKFDLRDQDIKNHIIYYQVKEDTIEGKVDFQEQIYFKYAMNGKAITQIIVNSMNVIIYANFDNYKRCKMPTASCHQYAINQQNPIVVHNEDELPSELILGVVGLEKSSFKVRFLNQMNGLQVKLGQKFSYLMDNEEKDLQLLFEFKKDDFKQFGEHVHFNLISPIHSLRMTVTNEAQSMETVEGYIAFDKKKIQKDLFNIKIEKINLFYDEYVHFTLVVTVNDIPVRIDSTTTHYERYGPKVANKFLIEYEPFEENALNIYTENMQKERGSMIFTVKDSKSIEGDESAKAIITKRLLRDYEFIDLNAELEEIDICDDVNCELEVTIVNEANVELEQSITLIREESVIGLDDSIWSVYEINELSKSNHFYFIPRHQNKSINILFNTDDNHLYINYRIFNTKNSINPEEWPFGHLQTEEVGHISNTQEIDILGNDPELIACWPTCVILINLNEGYQKEAKTSIEQSVIKSYKILATNSILELPEDTKLDFSLRGDEEKVLFVLVKNILKYEKLTFFTYYSFGRARITASVISNDVEYQLNKDKKFIFEDLETSLPTYMILSIINKEKLNPETVLLKITIAAETNLKMTLEYSSFIKDVYRLRMDDLEITALKKGEQIWYQFLPERDFTLKLYRMKGFPLFKVIKCTEENYLRCLNQNKRYFEAKTEEYLQTQQTVKQNLEKQIEVNAETSNKTELEVFVEKSYDFSEQQCDKCVFFLWIYCLEGDLEMTINLRTKFSEIELKEMNVLNERIEPGQHNRYLINMVHEKDAIVTIRILQGSARVLITENSLNLYNQTLDSVDYDYKDFNIAAQEDEDDEEEEEDESKNFGLVRKTNEKHIFKHAHITVTALSEKPVEFLISYSVEKSSVYLEDGIVIQKYMTPELPHTFYYRNKNRKERAYLTLSSEILKDADSANATNKLDIKFYYYPNAGDRSVKETFVPELPPNRNENYLGSTLSHVYELPAKYELVEIEISSDSPLKVTASINHQELVYLPLGFEYLIKLQPREHLNLVIDRPETQYLQVKIKKCDLSSPTLQYTNDARQFKKGIFEAEVDIDHSTFKQYINTKKSSKTIHLQLMGSEEGESLFTIAVASSSKQMKFNTISYRPGNKGTLNYKMVETDTVQVSFKPITCDNKECSVPFSYYLVVAQSLEEIYGELNCANSYFVPQAEKVLKAKPRAQLIVLNAKNYDKKNEQYRYRVKLNGNQAFIGVKGLIEATKEEVQYSPLEIRNIWGELSKISFGIVLMVSLSLALVLTVVIVVSTKLARRGYKPVSSEE